MSDGDRIAGVSASRAELLRRMLAKKGIEVRRDAIPRRDGGDPAPLSFSQERLWFIDRLEPGSSAYNMAESVRFRGRLDLEALGRTFAAIVERHEVLRTVYREVDGEPRQVVQAPAPLPLPLLDLTALPRGRRRAVLARLAAAHAALPFELATGPVLRLAVVRLAAEDHALLLAQHHIASDGWSLEILRREVAEGYRAFAAGGAPPWPRLDVQYADFAAWQRRQLSGDALQREVAWWRRRLAGLPPLLELPTDRPRRALRQRRSGQVRVTLDEPLAAALRGAGEARQATLFMTLLAAFQALLGRWSGQRDLAVGTPVAGRSRAELEPLIGFFVNTLVLRTELAGEIGFGRLVEQVRETVIDAQAHAELPFEKLVEELAPQRSLDHTPLFQVMFALQSSATGAAVAPSSRSAPPAEDGPPPSAAGLEARAAKFDLLLSGAETDDGLGLVLDYDRDLFDVTTARRLLAHLRRWLTAALAEPERPLETLPLASPAERQQVSREWATGAPWPAPGVAEGSIVERFAARVRAAPEAPALTWGGGVDSYAELDARSARLASWLAAQGVRRGDRVALCVERSPELVVALLAILRAGAAYVALEADYPAERLAFLLADSRSALLWVDASTAARLPEEGSGGGAARGPRRVDLGRALEESQALAPLPPLDLSGEDLAYVAYTSGSTGRPKGVAVPHRGVVRLAEAGGHATLSAATSFLLLAPVSFDASTLEIWGPLLAGGRVAVAPPGRLTLEEIGTALAEQEVSSLWLTAGLFHLMVDEHPKCLAPLAELLAGGDVLSPDHVGRLLALHPDLTLINGYGPTENTTFTACHRFREAPRGGRSAPLGRALGGTTVYVVDAALRPRPVGVAGELVTGGAGVARGYLGRPDLTAERFVPDPFGSAGSRLYRTGDRVRWLPSGELEFLGRIDTQVKVRGFRIEPGEIESALAAHPAVRECVVAARGEGAGDKVLVAYWTADETAGDGDVTDSAALRAHLAARLPDWMVPAHLVRLDALPLTPNGKVDRRALPDPQVEEAVVTPPRGAVEEAVAAVWREVLKIETVGRESDFFALGGHSLLATRVTSRLRAALGAEVELRALFEAPSLAAFAARVTAARSESLEAAPPLQPVDRTRPLPLSFAQERLWFLDRLEPGSAAYNVPQAVRWQGELVLPALAAALSTVVARHEVLRTVYRAEEDGEPRQVILPPVPVALPLTDLSALPAGRAAAEARRLAAAEAVRPFDLAAGPVLRAALLRRAADDHLVLLTLHHVATDGWSMGLLTGELTEAYRALAAGRRPELPKLPVQYADFAAWQRDWLSGERLGGEIDWWRGELAALPPLLELPTDRPRRVLRDRRSATVGAVVAPAEVGALRSFAESHGATPFIALLALFQGLLSRWSGQTDLAVGTPVAGRERLEVEPLVGFFVNTLVLRAEVDAEAGFAALLAATRERVLDAQAHAELPFEKLVEELAPQRSLDHTPLFQVMFAHQQAAPGAGGQRRARRDGSDGSDEGGADGLQAELRTAKFDLLLTSVERGDGGVDLHLARDRDLFDATTARRLLEHLRRLLTAAVAEPGRPLETLPLASAAERQQVSREWAAGAPWPSPGAAEGSLVERFAARVAAAPQATALSWSAGEAGVGSWSYGELDARSARLASWLAAQGVGRGDRVALCVERSPELVVALLAILRAGAAYVALEADYPAERLAFLLADSRSSLLWVDASTAARLPEEDGDDDGDGEGAARGPRRVDLGRALEESQALAPLPPLALSGEDLAYVAYTSGSTGRPKGVAVPHRGVVRLAEAGGHATLSAVTSFLLLAPVSFDASTLEIWGPLLAGGRVAVAPPGRLTLEEIGDALAEQEVSSLWLTAGLFHLMVDEHPKCLAPLTELLAGGDVLSPDHVGRLLALHPELTLINGYGPTENTTFTACHRFREAPRGGRSAPLGRALGGTTVYVVDAALRPRPVGVAGELVTGGAGVARGYLGRPDLTAERFVPDPFGSAGSRLYRTGDRVRWLPSGELEFLGRIDTQVKVRGFRIEPGEIESALAAHPAVRECVVVARGEGAGDKVLVAYWTVFVTSVHVAEVGGATAEVAAAEAADETADDGHVADSAALRAHLASRLPDWMVPAHLVRLDALPLTPNGKVDRRALPDPQVEEAVVTPPRGAVEEAVAAVWREVLKIETVGRESDFFALGGHSLLATRVTSRLRAALGVEVELRALFEAPTLAAFAASIEAARGAAKAVSAVPPLHAAATDGPAPLSFAQQRLWFLDRLEPGGSAYNVPLAVRLVGPLSAPALAAALDEVERRHEVLRSRYVVPAEATGDGEPRQVVEAPSPRPLPVVDLSFLAEEPRQHLLRRLAAEEAARPFDLAAGPVQRRRLLRLGSECHALLLTQHHVASDGWSVGILQRELSALYAAFTAGGPSLLPELAVQYADYARWQRGWLAGDVLAAEVEWWRRELDGLPPVLELPVDRPRRAVRSPRAGVASLALDSAVATAVRELAARCGATPFMVLLAAFQAFLGRHGGGTDLAVGTPVAGRTRLEVEPLIGFFVNTLVLRARLDPEAGFGDLVVASREHTLGAHAHQELPFEKLVEELAPQRSLSHAPLVQVMFVFQNTADAAGEEGAGEGPVELGAGLSLAPLGGSGAAETKFDLSLGIGEYPHGLSGSLEYAADLFDAATAEALARRFVTLLTAALEQPELPLAELPLLAPSECRQLLGEWSGAGLAAEPAAAAGGDGASLWHLFAAQAAATPTAPALSWVEATADGGTGGGTDVAHTWSYGELAARSLGVAAHLASLGAGPETRVGVLLQRTPELVTALLGTLATGAAYVPLDPAYPASRLELMLGDGGARLLVAESELPAELDLPAGLTVVRRGEDGALPSAALPADWASPAAPHHLAYVIFTSGSTGRPKGVAIEHRAATALVGWARRRYGADERAGVLAATSVCFDLSVYELFATLACGGTVVLADSALALPRVARQHRVTLVNTVPSAMAELVRSGAVPQSVTTVNLAGEALPRELADAIHGLGHVARLYNLYGPSEDTTYSTEARIGDDGSKPAIGRPLPGGRAYVVDASERPVPPGVAGELLLGGAGLARGYLGRPALTAERWVPDGLSGDAGARLYCTGDRARWLADGALDYLGRVDQQVKVRGFRIEPGEIEALLVSHLAVRECAVVARPGADGNLRLDAFWAASEGAEIAAADLTSWLADRLPAHMVPAALVELDELPLTPNGKVDRKALAAHEVTAGAVELEPPRGWVEETLAELWSEVLGGVPVGRRTDFFQLGGHSLLATRVTSRVRAAFDVELPVRSLFEAPTLAALAARIEAARRSEQTEQLPPLVPVDRSRPLPLSFAQQRLWFLDRLEPEQPTYNVPQAARLDGSLKVVALEDAIGEVRRRHAVLRSRFVSLDGEPRQVADAPAPRPMPLVDLSFLPAVRHRAELDRLAGEEAARPFDLAAGPVQRARLIRLQTRRHAVLLTHHHVVFDGGSVPLLLGELSALYAAYRDGHPSPLEEVAVQYADFSAWQRGWLTGDLLRAEVDWWRGELADLPPVLDLPTDRPRPALRSWRGDLVEASLSAAATAAVRRLALSSGATPFMVLLAAFEALLARTSGQRDFAVGTPVAGRDRLQLEPLIGFFVNTLVLRAEVDDGGTFADLVARVRRRMLAAREHQAVPFEKLVEELAPSRDLAHSPLFQVMFSHLRLEEGDTAAAGGSLGDLALAPLGGGSRGRTHFDLSLSAAEGEERLRLGFEYAADLFDRTTVLRLAGWLERLLAAALEAPRTPLDELSWLSPAERQQTRVEWSPPPLSPSSATPRGVAARVARQAVQRPHAVAVVDGELHLTYGELARRAGRLSTRLRAAGVGPETRVGVLLPRSADLVAALLAVLATGAAYVPLDPTYPRRRLEAMLEDAPLRALVGGGDALAVVPSLAATAAGGGTPVLRVTAAESGDEPWTVQEVPRPAAAYVIFTSGSTGRPKGVVVSHGSLSDYLASMGATFGVTPADRVLQFASVSFDASAEEMFTTLAAGATLVLRDDAVLDPAVLAERTARWQLTILNLPTAVWHGLAAHLAARPAADGPALGAGLRLTVLGGERALSAPLATWWRAAGVDPWRPAGVRLINTYGPTEATIAATAWEAWGVPAAEGQPIGRAVGRARVQVVDAALRPLPVGVAGELVIGGGGLARGYLGRPAATAERFLPDPFAGEAGTRLYRTGDRVRWLAAGELEFLGRVDQQVKVRGFRIEPGEVEATLERHPAVAGSAAVVVAVAAGKGGAGGEAPAADHRLVAYWVAATGVAAPSAADLRAWLAERLPEHMLPSHLIQAGELPLTPSGKVDRLELARRPLDLDVSAATGGRPPRGPVEELVAGVWGEVLGIAAGGVDAEAHFFALGGHSLLATRVTSRLRSLLAVEVPVRVLFEAPALAAFAARVAALAAGGAGAAAPPLRPADRSRPLPLSFAQERLWFLDRLEPGGSAYNLPLAVRLAGPLSAPALAAALDELERRHEVLRSRYAVPDDATGDGAPRQVVEPPSARPLPVVDLSFLPEEPRQRLLHRLAAAEAARPFDLAAGPVQRRRLLRFGGERHALLLTQHHVASDGWSVEILQRELSALYAAFAAGRPSPLPELAVQYADYALWQRGWLAGDVLAAEVEWWRGELDGLPPVLQLPVDRPRRAVRSPRAGVAALALDAAAATAVRELAARRGATPFMVLLAAFQAFLGRHGGGADLAVGTPVAGRTRLEVEPLIGFFVNTLVLRARFEPAADFGDLVVASREHTLGAHAHQELPFEKLVEELAPQRSLSHAPLVQVMFAFQNAAGAADAAGSGAGGEEGAGEDAVELGAGLSLAPLGGSGAAEAKFDLSLGLEEHPHGLSGGLEYAADLFDAATAEALARRFVTLLTAALERPELPLAELPLLAPAERRQLLGEWSGAGLAAWAAADGGDGASLWHLFAAQAAATPAAPALSWVEATDGGTGSGADVARTWSYGELAARSRGVAAHLASLGAGPETRVGVLLQRTPELVTALLGTLATGAAYVPLDPAYPASRLELMLGDGGARLLVAESELPVELGLPAGLTVVRRGADGALPSAALPADWASPAAPHHLAYVIFTSGSTGRPKGVAIEHRAATALVGWARRRYGADERAGVLAATSVCFDLSVYELFATLACGGTVVLADSALALPRVARHHRVTLLNTVPSAMAELVRSGAVPESVTTVNLAGEALPRELADAIHGLGHVERLYNLYGPSEDTTYSTEALIGDDGGKPAIGRPLPGGRAYVVDAAGRPVPPGVAGELLLGGAGLARGYLGRPALTAERWVPDGLSGDAGARLYRTGDRARWLADGTLDYLGRVDQQVKVRGFRIEPGEIEALLVSHPAVRECAVVARPGADGNLRLDAFWAAAVGEAASAAVATAADLAAWLADRLPAHMVPAALVELDELPLTPNGKVDRKALAARELTAGAAELEPPRGWVEETLAELWSEVLGGVPVGRRTDFFQLGGHSLLATRVTSRVRAAFAVELPVRSLFEAPTLAALAARIEAARIEAARHGAQTQAPPPLVPVDRSRPLPLSFAQERLWFLDRLEAASTAYNVPLAVRLSGELSVAALAAARGEVERRHEVLRSRYVAVGGVPRQVVEAPSPPLLPVVDLGHLGGTARRRELSRLAAAEAARPFDLAAGPVQRGRLLRLAPVQHALLVTQHHVATDGWSLQVLQGELAALYAAFAAGRPSPLPELAVQYADYAAWQRGWLSGDVLAAEVEWWRGELDGLPPVVDLPADRPRPALRSPRAGAVDVTLDETATTAVHRLAGRLGATPFMVLLAALEGLLQRHGAGASFAVGTPVAGRTRLEVEPLVGFFVNTLVLRAEVDAEAGFDALLAAVRERALAAHAHQEVPFEKLVEELSPQRSLSHTPLFQVLMAYQHLAPGAAGEAAPAAEAKSPAGGLRLAPLGDGGGAAQAKFDLSLGLEERGGRLAGGLEYAADLFDAATAEALARRFVTLLTAALEQPEQALAELPLLAPAERRQLLGEWSGAGLVAAPAAADGGDGASLWHLFAAQAAATPAAPALSWVEATDGGAGSGADVAHTWSYGELAARSLGVAAHLASLGAGPETRVGVLLQRTPELVTALLGTLATGAAYVPLDPAYPASRLELMLGDGGARLLVAEADLLTELDLPAGLTVVCRGADGALPSAAPPADWASPAAPHHLAYVIFTSGSTGRPKGVAIEHRAATALVGWARRRYGADERAGVLAATSVCFDLSVYELFATLACGGTVVLAESALALPRVARQHRVTLLNTVPSAMAELVRSGAVPQSVTTVNLAGEALPRELAQAIHDLGHVARLYNLYGPSEDTTYSTEALIGDDGGKPAIGRPLPGGRAYVVDASGRPVPPGVAGELLLGGSGLARGYLGRPELTAERWVPDGLSGDAGARLYRTGDRARWLADGTLDYLGRVDQQVKVRGFRIEPGEIEALLASHPAVRECAVVARPGADGHLRLDAFWAAEAAEAASVGAADLAAWLADRLPAHMVPAALAELDELPLTPNGKVDRKALAALPVDGGPGAAGVRVAPRDAVEAALSALWGELLGVGEVGVTEDFFALGGHSLLAVRLVSEVEARFGLRLPLAALFRGATVERVAALLARGGALAADEAAARPWIELRHGAGEEAGAGVEAGEDRPVFLLHAAGGSALPYLPLARRLPPGVAVVGLQDPELGTAEGGAAADPADTFRNLAARHVETLRRRQPAGPYRLAGWSLGGLLAFAVARQLETAGETVEWLLLLDAPAPEPAPPSEPGAASEPLADLAVFADVLGVDPARLDLSADELRSLRRRPVEETLPVLARRAAAAGLLPEGLDDGHLLALHRRVAALLAAAGAYRPSGPLAAPVTVLRAADEHLRQRPAGDDLGWSAWAAGRLAAVPVPGDHLGMLAEPAVAAVADRLAALLDS